MSNSVGNTNRDIRRFLREVGVRPTASNIDLIGREVRRTQSQNEQVERIHREVEQATGRPSLVDQRGDVKARAKAQVRRALAKRKRP